MEHSLGLVDAHLRGSSSLEIGFGPRISGSHGIDAVHSRSFRLFGFVGSMKCKGFTAAPSYPRIGFNLEFAFRNRPTKVLLDVRSDAA